MLGLTYDAKANTFDLVFAKDIMSTDNNLAFQTLVYALLFADAEDAKTTDRYERRGWWFDSSFGSLLWCYRKDALRPDVRRDVIAHIKYVLDAHPALSDVVVVDESRRTDVTDIRFSISATFNGLSANSTVVI